MDSRKRYGFQGNSTSADDKTNQPNQNTQFTYESSNPIMTPYGRHDGGESSVNSEVKRSSDFANAHSYDNSDSSVLAELNCPQTSRWNATQPYSFFTPPVSTTDRTFPAYADEKYDVQQNDRSNGIGIDLYDNNDQNGGSAVLQDSLVATQSLQMPPVEQQIGRFAIPQMNPMEQSLHPNPQRVLALPHRNGIQQPPSHGIQQPPSHGIQQPPSHGIQQPPSHGIQQPPTHGIQQPPSHGIQQQPSHGIQQPPSHVIQEQTSHGIQQPPSHAIQQPPSHGIQQPPSHGIQQPPSHGIQQPPSHGIQQPPSHGIHQPPSHGIQQPPSHALRQPPSHAIQQPPRYGIRQPNHGHHFSQGSQISSNGQISMRVPTPAVQQGKHSTNTSSMKKVLPHSAVNLYRRANSDPLSEKVDKIQSYEETYSSNSVPVIKWNLVKIPFTKCNIPFSSQQGLQHNFKSDHLGQHNNMQVSRDQLQFINDKPGFKVPLSHVNRSYDVAWKSPVKMPSLLVRNTKCNSWSGPQNCPGNVNVRSDIRSMSTGNISQAIECGESKTRAELQSLPTSQEVYKRPEDLQYNKAVQNSLEQQYHVAWKSFAKMPSLLVRNTKCNSWSGPQNCPGNVNVRSDIRSMSTGNISQAIECGESKTRAELQSLPTSQEVYKLPEDLLQYNKVLQTSFEQQYQSTGTFEGVINQNEKYFIFQCGARQCLLRGGFCWSLYGLKLHMKTHDKISHICDKCHWGFQSKASLQEHQKTHDLPIRFQCKICGEYYVVLQAFFMHMKSHGEYMNYECEHCTHCSHSAEDMYDHARIHFQETRYQCPVCRNYFSSAPDYQSHLSTHEKATVIFECDICNLSLYSAIKLENHKQDHIDNFRIENSVDYQTSTICHENGIDTENHHLQMSDASEQFERSTINSSDSEYKNTDSVSKPDSWKCDMCNKYFVDRFELEDHNLWVHQID